jgi:type VI secretion system protein ImpJ
LDVYLALPTVIEGRTNVVAAVMEGQSAARYKSRSVTTADETMGIQNKEIEVGSYNFGILFGDESLDNHATVQIAKLVRNATGAIELSPTYIPPLLNTGASLELQGQLRSLLEMLLAKIHALSSGRKNVEGGFAEFSSGEETAFRLLQTLNTYTPLLNHYHSFPHMHPYDVFGVLTQFAGSLCTFSSEVSIKNLPRYDHVNIASTFSLLIKVIRTVLEADIQAGCVPVPLEQVNPATWVCKVPDEKLLTVAKFFFGVSANVPEKELVVGVLQRIKMCSRNKLDLLISSAMPGLPMRHTMHPPQDLSTKPGFVYFALDQQGDFWQQIKATNSIAFYFPNNYPELKVEMIALKE